MNPINSYIVEALIASLILGTFYYAFLKNLTFFKLNRFYLLAALILPMLFPLLKMPEISTSAIPNLSVVLDEITIGTASQEAVETSTPHILQWLYLSIALVLAFKIIVGLISIFSLFRKSEKLKLQDIKLYLSPENVNPFSVFKRIVISKDTYNDQKTLSGILIHEQAHINQHHGIDSFLAEILCAAFWFNPMVWLLKKELKSTHEYLADEKVLEQDFDLAEYFMLIFNNIIGKNVVLANNFNQSLNLKRMKMMKKKRSSRFAKVMSVIAVPVFMIATVMFTSQCTGSTESIDETIETKSSTVTTDNKVFTVVEQMPQFPGGETALMKYLRGNVNYPAEAQEYGIQGRVIVEFVIDKSGAITNVSALKVNIQDEFVKNDVIASSSAAARILSKEAKRVVEEMPDWTPGMQRGKNVSVQYRLPINFSLK